MTNRFDVRSATVEELQAFMKSLGQPAYRGKQLFRQAQKLAAAQFEDMTDLPAALRAQLAEQAVLTAPTVLAEQVSAAGDTGKLLLEMADGERVEMALMLYERETTRNRATCCVSSQTGCAMGCRFCATGMFDRFRNLTAGEIVSQVQLADAMAKKLGFAGVTNVVYMGMGEPLANPKAVRRSIELLNHAEGMQLGARRITVSTCGLVPQIYEMMQWGLQIGLAVSLHSAHPEKRKQLMPGASHWGLDELKKACMTYQEETGRRVTYEYALIKEVNDSPEDAALLCAFLTETKSLVNIIPANPLPERGIEASSDARCKAFCQTLEREGIEVQVRESRGRDIQAACGQLRKRME